MRSTGILAVVLSFLLVSGVGCGGDDDLADGTLAVTVYGEDFIEEGIPGDEMVDGWAVTFDVFLVNIGEVRAEAGSGELAMTEYGLIDVAQASGGNGFVLASREVAGGDYDDVTYTIAPSASTRPVNTISDDVDIMTAGGYSVYVEGSADKNGVTKSFAWGFQSSTRYHGCESVARVDGDTGTSQVTIHGDHLFFDMLTDAEPNVAFELIASADANDDDEITRAELQAVSLAAEARYQVGSLPVEDLWTFIDYQVRLVGHIDGEGHCNTELL